MAVLEEPKLVSGKITHSRFFPQPHHFTYKSLYIAFPLSKIQQLSRRLLSLNHLNFFGFYPRDYGDGSQNMENWLQTLLKKNHIKNIHHIVLYTHPRVLGYVFNPVSFWLCFNDKQQLLCVLSEVTNTAKQKHYYLCYKPNHTPINNDDWLTANKQFYVSPFMKIEGNYQFRFEFSEGGIRFLINYFVNDRIKLHTCLKCEYQALNDKNLLRYFFKLPLITLRTTLRIHYQALRLALKKIAYDKYPKPLKNNLTVSHHEKKDL